MHKQVHQITLLECPLHSGTGQSLTKNNKILPLPVTQHIVAISYKNIFTRDYITKHQQELPMPPPALTPTYR